MPKPKFGGSPGKASTPDVEQPMPSIGGKPMGSQGEFIEGADGKKYEVPTSFMNPGAADPSPVRGSFTAPTETLFPAMTGSPLGAVLNEGKKPARITDSAWGDSSKLPWNHPDILCHKCKHCHMVQAPAPVGGRKTDGSYYVWYWAQCLRTSPPTELEDAKPLMCNLFEPATGSQLEAGAKMTEYFKNKEEGA